MTIIQDPPNISQLEGANKRPTPAWANWFARVYLILSAHTSSGTTAQRPTDNLWTGRQYFDTTLGHPIWHNGTNWVDATGATV